MRPPPCRYWARCSDVVIRTSLRIAMFSPSFWTSACRADSTVVPPSAIAVSALTSAGFAWATSCASFRAKSIKSPLRATKSVSQLSSTIAADLRSAPMVAPMIPSVAMRSAALDAFAPLLMRSSSSALPKSPSVSVSAFLHSIIPSPVRPRSSITMLAVTSAITCSLHVLFATPPLRRRARKIGARTGSLAQRCCFVSGNLDEFLGLYDLLNDLALAFEDRVGDAARVQSYGAARVVIARDNVSDSFGRMVGIDHPDDRNRQLGRFGHRDLLITNVDDEQGVGQRVHFLDAAEAPGKLFHLSLQRQRLAFAHFLERPVLGHRLQVLEPLDRNLDRFEIGQHAAEPAMIDERHAGALRFLGDDFARLALGSDEQDGAAVGRKLTNVLHCVLIHRQRLFEVDD